MTRATSKPPKAVELTFDQYMATPETVLRHDVIDGVIVMSPSPTGDHQLVTLEFATLLNGFVGARQLGTIMVSPFDLLIRKTPKLRVRQPDVAFFSFARISREQLRRSKIVEVAPDLAIEVRSEQESEARWLEKLVDYASIGIPEVWRVYLMTDSIEVLALDAGRYVRTGVFREAEVIRSQVLPGLDIPVAAFFA